MSDTVGEVTPGTGETDGATVGTTTEVVETPEVKPKEEDTELEKWKALSRKNEKQAKDNQARIKELEGLATKNQSLVQEITALKNEKTTLLRSSIAAEHGLPTGFADRLTGQTEEELKEDAKSLAALLGPGSKSVKPTTFQGTDNPGIKTGKIKSYEDYLNHIKN